VIRGSLSAARRAGELPRTAAGDVSLDTDIKVHNVLRATADDPVMRDVQDQFFDKTYFARATKTADQLAIQTPLGIAVVYDSIVHGSFPLIRGRVQGTPTSLGERPWITAYVAARRTWLATQSRADLRATVYRMDAMHIRADGVYGKASANHVADHQRAIGAPVTGVADRPLVLSLAAEVLTGA
jgi:chitosanase